MPFKPGNNANPNGRPKGVLSPQQDVTTQARRYTKSAINTLVRIMRDPNASEAARVRAAETLLARGWGQAPQHRVDIVAQLSDRDLEAAAAQVLEARQAKVIEGTVVDRKVNTSIQVMDSMPAKGGESLHVEPSIDVTQGVKKTQN